MDNGKNLNHSLSEAEKNKILEYGLSEDEKISILGLSKERVNSLKSMKVIHKDFRDNHLPAELKIIKCDLVIGTCSPGVFVNNWYDLLVKQLHKNINFVKFGNRDAFAEFLVTKNWFIQENMGYPEVLEIKGKYYITGNGHHRLTIAKSLGGLSALAVVIKAK